MPTPEWWVGLLFVPVVVALLPSLFLLLGVIAERRETTELPLLAGRLLFPRVWAANTLGVLFLAMSDEGWQHALSAGPTGVGAVVLFGLLALGYLILEVQRASASPRPRSGHGGRSFTHALRLWLTSLNQSIVLVLAVQLYLGPVMLERASDNQISPLLMNDCAVWLNGTIYPSALLTWSFGGMFFGLLLQALWEETPLSEGFD